MSTAVAGRTAADVSTHRAYVDRNLPNGEVALDYINNVVGSYDATATVPNFALRPRLSILAQVLYQDTFALSNPQVVVGHPAFKEVQNMGPEVLPIICQRIEREPFVWLTALPVLVGESPVSREHRGKMRLMIEDWKGWARARGFIHT